MKHLLLIAAFAIGYTNVQAQDMNAVLMKTMAAFDSTQDPAKRTEYANKVELIAKKWKDEWAPHYYNAYAKAILTYSMPQETMEKRDAILDEAEAELDEAVTLMGKKEAEENSEVFVLKAVMAQARMIIDGRNRWQTYGKLFEDNLRAAKEKDESNPRIYYLKGTSVYFTPKAFGGGPKKALEYFEKAKPLFAQETKGDMKDPFWGSQANDFFIQQCNNPEQTDDAGTSKGADGSSPSAE
ncbi:MAG: hypothetical protein H6551_02545 [Chitinophagales bacterium]|nr:hypothetical protein [Chitinophagaceae bacterium]MCB9064001.1 hypothetical protein [Chitinophagales bacterium]